MNQLTRCPDLQCLLSLVEGRLPEEEQVIVTGHLERCPTCQDRLETTVGDTALWAVAARHRDYDPQLPAALLEEVLARHAPPTASPQADRTSVAGPALDFLSPSEHSRFLGRLGSYEVLDVVGFGGMGIVLKAFDNKLRRSVALKVLAPHLAANPVARQRFLREAHALAAIQHENVVAVHAVEEEAGLPFLVMDFIEGTSLQERIDAGPLELPEILHIARQVAHGLAAAHARGLVHRDIKPSNILLSRDHGPQTKVKLTDFGLARALDDLGLTQVGVVAGTPQYMAPEQARGESVDQRADLFSLGSVLYAMCTGQSPFGSGAALTVLARVGTEEPTPIRDLNPAIPTWLTELIATLHAKDPGQRFASAAMVAELLERQQSRPSRARPPFRLFGRRGALVLALFGVCAVIGLGWLLISGGWNRNEGNGTEPEVGSPGRASRPVQSGPPRVLVVLPTKGFFWPDYQPVRSALEERGVVVVVAAPTRAPAQPKPGDPVHVPAKPDLLLAEARGADYDAIYFPGGEGIEELCFGPHAADARRLIREAVAAKRYVTALGVGPVVLAEAGVLQGVRATCYRFGEPPRVYINWLKRAGAIFVEPETTPVVVSGLIITAHGPIEARAFATILADQLGIDKVDRQ